MIARIVLAVVVGVIVTLACTLVGALLQDLTVKLAVTVGDFLQSYAGAFGVLAALWYFFAGYKNWPNRTV